jgi:hypothetical protein
MSGNFGFSIADFRLERRLVPEPNPKSKIQNPQSHGWWRELKLSPYLITARRFGKRGQKLLHPARTLSEARRLQKGLQRLLDDLFTDRTGQVRQWWQVQVRVLREVR